MNHAGQGKIQRAPLAIRNELCRRLLDGQSGPEVLPWLNALPEIKAVCAAYFDGLEVSAKNLSDFRTGYYEKWIKHEGALIRQQILSEHALEIVRTSGRHLSSAAAALAAGRLIEAVDALADQETPPAELVKSIAMLRAGDIDEGALQARVRDLELREETAAWKLAEKVFAALQERALPAVDAGENPDDPEGQRKMRDIVRIMAGDDLLARMEARRKEAS